MKICLISAFPPSRGVLNEYGYHVAKELQADPVVSVTVLADELPASILEPELAERSECLAQQAGLLAVAPQSRDQPGSPGPSRPEAA